MMLGYYALAPVPGMPAVSVGERHRVYKRSAKGHRLTAGLTTVACLRRSHTCTSANTSEVSIAVTTQGSECLCSLKRIRR
jgi:hypothetical protein